MKKYGIIILLIWCLVLPGNTVLAGDESVNITGTTIWGDTDKNIAYIEGNVRISQGKTLLVTNKAEINIGQKTAILNQGVQLTNPEVFIKAEILEYNLKKKTGTFKNNVFLQQFVPKSKPGEAQKDPFDLTAGELYFESDTKNFTAKENARIENKDLTGTADAIIYNDKEQQLAFTGNVVLNRNTAKTDQNQNGQEPFKLTAGETYVKTDTKDITAKEDAKIENKDFTGTADTIEYNDKEQKLVFTGNVRITQGTTVLTTDEGEINLDNKQLVFKDHIQSVNDNINIEADGLEYDYNNKTGTFKKNVVLNRDAVKADSKNAAQDPFKLTADELYIETDTKNFTAKNNGIIEHKDFNGGGDIIEYNDKLQQLTIEDNAYLNHSDGEEIKGDSITIDLHEKSLTVYNNGAVSVDVNGDSGT